MLNKKKSVTLLAITMVLAFLVFGFDAMAKELETAGPVLTEAFTESGKEYFDLVKSLSDNELDDYIDLFRKEGKDGEASGLESWKAIKEDLGEFVKYEDCTVYRTDGGAIVISIIAEFRKAKAVMTLSMASEMQDVYYVKFESVKTTGILPYAAACAVLLSVAIFVVIMHKKSNKDLTSQVKL